MKEIPLTRGLAALVDDEDYDFLSRWKWFANAHGYAARNAPRCDGGSPKQKTVYMHREILGLAGSKPLVDHINGNRIDNRRTNLRECDEATNNYNAKIRADNRSGFKGVSWKLEHKKWMARIRDNGKTKHLGYFDTPEAAHAKYCEAAKKLYGEFANFGDSSNNAAEAA